MAAAQGLNPFPQLWLWLEEVREATRATRRLQDERRLEMKDLDVGHVHPSQKALDLVEHRQLPLQNQKDSEGRTASRMALGLGGTNHVASFPISPMVRPEPLPHADLPPAGRPSSSPSHCRRRSRDLDRGHLRRQFRDEKQFWSQEYFSRKHIWASESSQRCREALASSWLKGMDTPNSFRWEYLKRSSDQAAAPNQAVGCTSMP